MEGPTLNIAELLAAVPVAAVDLHGLSAREAERRVSNFIDEHTRRSPGRVVEVVTGKGLRSAGRPVLPGLVRELLQGPLAPSVSEWAGTVGGGAVRVRLRGAKGRGKRS